ncbi:MAG: TonB-dependent receptor [Planctomycetia bacterium]|nr:TonB-dependent receptor [Planctomycetia bacterium]
MSYGLAKFLSDSLPAIRVAGLVAALAVASPTARAQPLDSNAATGPSQRTFPEGPGTIVEGALAPGVGSQGSATPSNTVLTTPNLTPTTLATTGSSVTVITAEQIQQKGQVNVAEVLRGVPGLDVVRAGTPGGITSVFIRGAASQETKVLIDGVPANDTISPGGGYDFANLSVDNIERIEVLRGPQSVLYGSDALGGVISIITKKGQGAANGKVSVLGGSFSTMNSAANAGGSSGPIYYSVAGSYFDTNGFSAASSRLPGNVEKDGFQLGTLSTRTGWQPSENVNLDFTFRYNQGNVDTDKGGGAFKDDPNDSNTIQQAVAGVRLKTTSEAGWYEQQLSYYVSDIKRGNRVFPNAPEPYYTNALYRGNIQQVNWRNTFHVLDTERLGNSVTVGAAYQSETGSNSTDALFSSGPYVASFPKTSLDDGAVFGENQLRLNENWYTTVGVRSDHYNVYGAHDTYRCTSLYRVPGTNTGIHGTLGTGFRAPTIYQRFAPGGFGNPALVPETSKGWDVGIEQPMFDGQLVPNVTYFRNDFNNYIDFSLNTYQYYNVTQFRSSGVEFSTLFVLSDVSTLTTSYTYTDTLAPSTAIPPPIGTGAQLLRRPRNKFGVTYNRKFWNGRANWNVNGIYVGARDDAIFDEVNFGPDIRVRLADYVVVNTALSYDVSQSLQVIGRIDNLFNENYEELYGYGVAPVSAYAGASLRF